MASRLACLIRLGGAHERQSLRLALRFFSALPLGAGAFVSLASNFIATLRRRRPHFVHRETFSKNGKGGFVQNGVSQGMRVCNALKNVCPEARSATLGVDP